LGFLKSEDEKEPFASKDQDSVTMRPQPVGAAHFHEIRCSPLFSLTPGFSRGENAERGRKTVSTVFSCLNAAAPARPLKRPGPVQSAGTGLKPGVNETLQ
jgi:hypothetical protein